MAENTNWLRGTGTGGNAYEAIADLCSQNMKFLRERERMREIST